MAIDLMDASAMDLCSFKKNPQYSPDVTMQVLSLKIILRSIFSLLKTIFANVKTFKYFERWRNRVPTENKGKDEYIARAVTVVWWPYKNLLKEEVIFDATAI